MDSEEYTVTDFAPLNSNVGEIETIIRNWEHAIQTGDMAAVIERHADDIVMYDVPEPLQSKGIEAYRRTWDLFFHFGAPGPGVFVIEDLEISAGEDVAFAFGLLRIGGSEEPVCRLTLGLQKRAGQWVISHEHHSGPHALEPSKTA